MKGVTIETDEVTKRRSIRIDLAEVDTHGEGLDELMDLIIAEGDKDQYNIFWSKVKQELGYGPDLLSR